MREYVCQWKANRLVDLRKRNPFKLSEFQNKQGIPKQIITKSHLNQPIELDLLVSNSSVAETLEYYKWVLNIICVT